ncbi:MAG TPA: glycoside hydrolase, partial [Thermoanaerobaculia bacterium]|nr:glycoside hydrolase [Thermoanaerobaculia bacterium]
GDFLFRPQLARRVRWNTNTDTPLPPEEPAGENPPDGAVVDYYLKGTPSAAVTLDVLDSSGKLVRRFSSADRPEPVNPKELPIPTYWIRPPQALSGQAGFHRFVWDLHYPPPDAIEHEYPIAAVYRNTARQPLGPWALPGDYTVRLTAGGKTQTQPLKIEMDPRVTASPDDLRSQFELSTRITAAMHPGFEALQQVKALRKDLAAVRERAAQSPAADAVAALEKKAAALEETSPRFGAGGPDEVAAPSFTRLNRSLATLLEIVDGADAKPTSRAAADVAETEKALAAQLAAWKEIQSTDVPALNQELKKSSLPAVGVTSSSR